jgi:Protein of unknown function (DUF3892)
MTEHEIGCSVLDVSHRDRVMSIGSRVGERFSVQAVLDLMKSGDIFRSHRAGFPNALIRPTAEGRYITTNADGTKCNNLHNLPRCP